MTATLEQRVARLERRVAIILSDHIDKVAKCAHWKDALVSVAEAVAKRLRIGSGAILNGDLGSAAKQARAITIYVTLSMYAGKLTRKEIAERLGMSERGVGGAFNRVSDSEDLRRVADDILREIRIDEALNG